MAMTSPPEMTNSVARRRSAGVPSDATTKHVGMFSWSVGHLSVRDLVLKELVQIPTIVRISRGYTGENRLQQFNFQEGTLYLVRSSRFHQLVVAQTPDNAYVTIPRDCPLTFHLLSNDDTLANAALTLADILGGSEEGDEGPCNGQRVQLTSEGITQYGTRIAAQATGRLKLKDIYKELFLICHAFIGGVLSSRLTVIPGYLPLKLNITRSMTSGADLASYISVLCQAAIGYSTDYDLNDPQEIAVFAESPNNHYEWIEPRPLPKPDLNPFSTFKPTSLAHSKSAGDTRVPTTSSQTRPDGGRFSLDSQMVKRPLPPIPQEAEKSKPETTGIRVYRKYDSSTMGTSPLHGRANGTKSRPWTRTGSEPNLLEDQGREQRLSSSQSFECLNTVESPVEKSCLEWPGSGRDKASLSLPRRPRPLPICEVPPDTRSATMRTGPVLPPPPPARPTPEEIVYNFCARSKRNSVVRRQRPVSPTMRRRIGLNEPLEYTSAFTVPGHLGTTELLATTTPSSTAAAAAVAMTTDRNRRLDVHRPADVDLERPVMPSIQYNDEEDLYDRIASPTYVVMGRSNATGHWTPQPATADTATGPSMDHTDGVYTNMRPGSRPLTTARHQSSTRDAVKFYLEDDDGYCLPQSLTRDDVERGQGVGAEDLNQFRGPATNTSNPGRTVTSPTSPPINSFEGVGFTSLDEVPTDLGSLSVEEVLQCLRWLNLHRHVDRFRAEQIDGELLMSVDQQVLTEELGFKRLDAIKLEKFARNGWRPKMISTDQHQYYNQQHQPSQQSSVHPELLYPYGNSVHQRGRQLNICSTKSLTVNRDVVMLEALMRQRRRRIE